MKRKRHTPQEIIAKLREAEVDLNQGATIEAVCRKLEISEQTFHRWRHLYGGMHASATFAPQRCEASSLAGDLRILAPQHSRLCTKPRSLKKPEFLTATYFSLSFSTEGGGAGDSGVGAVFRQQQRDFAAARIDGPLRQFVLHAGEELAHQLRHAAAEYDDVRLQ